MTIQDPSTDSGTLRQFYEALLQSARYSLKDITGFQNNVLKDLIPFVAKNVPFYAKRLQPVMRADGSFNPENWNKIPILTAAEMRANSDGLRAYDIPPTHGELARYVTSGSTGDPVTFYRSGLSEVAQTAAQFRHFQAFNIDGKRNLALVRAFDPALSRSRPQPLDPAKPPWTTDWFAGGNAGYLQTLSVFTPIAKQVEWLCGLNEVYLNTFPSNALAIARHVARNPQMKPKLLAILTAGEILSDEVRRQCSKHLGCACIDLYSSAECGLIACDCAQQPGMHVQSELARVEILDSKDKPAKPGEWGRLIVSPLYNFAMPLIRYESGDLARVAPPCQCGSHHQAIERGESRPSQMFYRPGKGWFVPEIDTGDMEELLGNNRWKLVQTGASEFELHYMPVNANFDLDERKVRAFVKSRLGANAAVTIITVAALGPSGSGKYISDENRFKT